MTPNVYLDTSVLSGAARGDMKAADQSAFNTLTGFVRQGRLSFCASTVAREEIDKIPSQHRPPHDRELNAVRLVKASIASWIDDDRTSTGFGTVQVHPDYAKLRRILPDENDARHLFLALQAGVKTALTVDERTVLNRAAEIQREVGLTVVRPSAFLSNWSTGR